MSPSSSLQRGRRDCDSGPTRSTDLDVAKELLIGFAGAGESTRPEGPAWFRMEDALMLYARHMERRPSYKMVCWTCDILADFCKRHDILYATQFTLDRQDTYIRERSLEIKRHKGSVSNATLNRELGTLRTALHFAWKCGRLSHEPYVQLLPEPPPRERVLTPEECRRLMEVSRRWPHFYLFIRLALFTLQRMTLPTPRGDNPQQKPQIPMLRNPGEIGVEFAQSRPSRNRFVQSQPATTHPIAPCDPVGDPEFDAIVRTFEQRWLEQRLPIDEEYWRNILMENARANYRSKRGIR